VGGTIDKTLLVIFYGDNMIVLNAKTPNSSFKDDDLICYCFEYTKRNIEEDFTTNGRSTILERIKKEKSINGCSCEIKNPKGK
jgi:hypothetical protein